MRRLIYSGSCCFKYAVRSSNLSSRAQSAVGFATTVSHFNLSGAYCHSIDPRISFKYSRFSLESCSSISMPCHVNKGSLPYRSRCIGHIPGATTDLNPLRYRHYMVPPLTMAMFNMTQGRAYSTSPTALLPAPFFLSHFSLALTPFYYAFSRSLFSA